MGTESWRRRRSPSRDTHLLFLGRKSESLDSLFPAWLTPSHVTPWQLFSVDLTQRSEEGMGPFPIETCLCLSLSKLNGEGLDTYAENAFIMRWADPETQGSYLKPLPYYLIPEEPQPPLPSLSPEGRRWNDHA